MKHPGWRALGASLIVLAAVPGVAEAHGLVQRQQLPIPIGVTMNDSAVYRIHSDGQGEYVNGTQGMLAVIDQFGNLQITPNNGGGDDSCATPDHVRLQCAG